MSVYVDRPVHKFRHMLMCHMLADTPAELHAMADRIGMARKWYQSEASTPHYDISEKQRAAAVVAGAIEVDRRGVVSVIRRIRASRLASPDGGIWERDRRETAPTDSRRHAMGGASRDT